MATKAQLELQDRMEILEIEEIEKQENKDDEKKMKIEKKEDPKNSDTIHKKYYKAYHERRERNTKIINEIYVKIDKRNNNMEGGQYGVMMSMLLEINKQFNTNKQEMKTFIQELKRDNQELKQENQDLKKEINKILDKNITELRDEWNREKNMFVNGPELEQDSKEKKMFQNMSWANEMVVENEFKCEEIKEIPTLMENVTQLEVVMTMQEGLLTPRKLEVIFKEKFSQQIVVKEHVHGYKNLIEMQKLEIQKLKLELLSRKDLPKINDELRNENSILKIQNKSLCEEIQKVNSIKLTDEKITLLDKKIINQDSNKIIYENIIEKFHYKSKEILLENFIKIKIGKFKMKMFISNKNSKIKKIKWKYAKFHYMQISGIKRHKIAKTFTIFKTKFKLNSLRKIKNKKKIKTVTSAQKTKFGKYEFEKDKKEWTSTTEMTLKKNIKCKMKKW